MKIESLTALDHIVKALFDKKAINIVAIDVKEFSTLTDFFVIAEASVDIHARALAARIVEEMKLLNISPIHMEGMQEGDWIVVDFMDIVVHILLPEMRQKYKLEQLWQAGKIVEIGEIEEVKMGKNS